MKALIVGLGSIGCRHLNNLYQLGLRDLSAFRFRNLTPPIMIPEKVTIYNDYERALTNHPDIVVIANPSSMHIPYSQQALEAGCHIYLEKPISHNLNDTQELTDLARKKRKVILVGCQLRFHHNLVAIKEWLTQNLIGNIHSVFCDVGEHLPDWHPWEDYRQSYAANENLGGGVILTLIHELDYLYWFFGKITQIYAIGGHKTPLKITAEDTALLSMLTKDKIPIQLRMDYWRQPSVRKLHIVGDRGEISWNYYSGQAILQNENKIIKKSSLPDTWERNDLFLSIIKHFLDCIENRSKPLIPLTEGIEVLKIALAAKESLKKRRVVDL